MTWTPPRTWSAGENPRSMNLNTFIRDNTTYLKAKTLVQFHANSWDEVPGSSPDYQEGGTGNVIRWWDFDPDTVEVLAGQWMASESLVGDSNPTIKIVWSATATTGDVVWRVRIGVVSDGDDPLAPAFRAFTVTDAPNTAAGRRVTAEVSVTGLTFAADDLIVIQLDRLATDAADTLATDARLHHVSLEHA